MRRSSRSGRDQDVRDLGGNRGRPDATRQRASGTGGDIHGRRTRRGARDARARRRRTRARRKRRQGERRGLRPNGRNSGHLNARRPEILQLPKRHPRVESSDHILNDGDERRGEAQPLRRGERQERGLRGVLDGVQLGITGDVLPEGRSRGRKLTLQDEVSEQSKRKETTTHQPGPICLGPIAGILLPRHLLKGIAQPRNGDARLVVKHPAEERRLRSGRNLRHLMGSGKSGESDGARRNSIFNPKGQEVTPTRRADRLCLETKRARASTTPH
jgi:hypothetical protein